MIKGNEKDCICANTDGHEKYCDAYRLAEFIKEVAAVEVTTPASK